MKEGIRAFAVKILKVQTQKIKGVHKSTVLNNTVRSYITVICDAYNKCTACRGDQNLNLDKV